MASRFSGEFKLRATLSRLKDGSRPPITAVLPARKIPAFSRAMASSVLPRYS